jgi:nucleoside-diphosphate-sugar epimerase
MRMAAQIAKVRLPMQGLPGLLRAMSGMMRVLEKVIAVPESYTSEYLRVMAGTTYIGKNDKARRELGYAPRSLEEGWGETVKHEMGVLGMK